jgi:ABC-type branched-subunit amino acid transport system permease subunit
LLDAGIVTAYCCGRRLTDRGIHFDGADKRMTTIASFLIGIAGSLAARVLLSLGFVIFSYAGVSLMFNQIIGQMQGQYNSLPAATLAMANLGGAGEFFGIITGAFLARLTLIALKRFRLQ